MCSGEWEITMRVHTLNGLRSELETDVFVTYGDEVLVG